MKLKLSTLIICLFSLVVLMSCGSSGSGEGDSDSTSVDKFGEAQRSLKEGIKDITSNIPPPSEIPYKIMQTGAEYNQSLINDRSRVMDYSAQPDKAVLNLGVYAADIGYLCSYDKTQESIDYMNACKRLADNLGITGSFDPEYIKEFERNIGNKDKLTALLDKAIKETREKLGDSQRKLGALLVTGSFMESLYIATGLVKSYPKDAFNNPKQRMSVLTDLINTVLKQRASVSDVTNMLGEVEQTELIKLLVADLKELEKSYAAVASEEQKKSNDPSRTYNDQTLARITPLVEKIRANIVK